MSAVLMGGFRLAEPPKAAVVVGQAVVELSNTKELGKLLYSQYLYPLEVAAVILLVAIIAAIALTLRERKDSKHIDPADQIRVKRADRVRLVKMNPTMAAPPQEAPVEEKKA
jgi:NADH-quinone oxidoreductase subunit J